MSAKPKKSAGGHLAPALVEKSHAELGASSADRWMNCPGSVALSRGLPDPETEAAREGTAAHAVAERALLQGKSAHEWIGLTIEGVEITQEMAEGVMVFVDTVRNSLQRAGAKLFVEERFSLAALQPPAPMFGTSDALIHFEQDLTLEVWDLKFGSGYVVEVQDNPQLFYYALGALLTLEQRGLRVRRVRIGIVQPRARHAAGAVRWQDVDAEDIISFAVMLLEAARRALESGAELKIGRWCRFCRAKAICPEQQKHAESLAEVEFSAPGELVPRDIRGLSPEQLGEMLEKAEIVKKWIASLYAAVQESLEKGTPVPGWKLVQKRAMRRWREGQDAMGLLLASGLRKEDITEAPELRSPAQIEKLCKSTNTPFPKELIEAKSSGHTLAPEYDTRDAIVLTPGDEFLSLPA